MISVAKQDPFYQDQSGANVSLLEVSDRYFSTSVKSGGPYSTIDQKDGTSTVMFAGERFPVHRHKSDRSRIKSCSCSLRNN